MTLQFGVVDLSKKRTILLGKLLKGCVASSPEQRISETKVLALLSFSQLLHTERLSLNHANTPGFLAPGGEEFNPGPEMRLDRSELLCNKVLLKYKGYRESF